MISRLFIAAALFVCCLVACTRSLAQVNTPDVAHQQWHASWVSVPGIAPNGFGVYLFKKTINLNTVPVTFTVHVSADNRYKLFVNGQLAELGPARGDQLQWNYETVNIAPWLHTGANTITAEVWNEGDWKPEAQRTLRTAFIMQGATTDAELLNTNSSWKCIRDTGYAPLPVTGVNGFYVTGAGELNTLSQQVKNFASPDTTGWVNAQTITPGMPKGVFSFSDAWMLVPGNVPPMELQPERFATLRNTPAGIVIPKDFPANKTAITIPAKSTVTLLLDQGHLTNAYFQLLWSKGKDAVLSVKYAEALYRGKEKTNRNQVEGLRFDGREDRLLADGSDTQAFVSRWYRTYRYVQLVVTTQQEPLVLQDVSGTFTGYPFRFNAGFNGGDSLYNRILATGWRTARLCATETYMDCPYYEQLQYIGDTRIQALVSYFNSGDDRLARNALNLMDASRIADGVTLSRYPTNGPQIIPPFSLWYIGMLHDYMQYRPDTAFIRDKLPGVRQILSFFSHYQQPDGSLQHVPYWPFTDWVNSPGWFAGIAPVGSDGRSSVLDLQLLLALQLASQLEAKLGIAWYANSYAAQSRQLAHTILQQYWDPEKQLLSDTPEKKLFSQHANALAVLTGIVAGDKALAVGKKILADSTLAPASIYFKYYVHAALVKAGMGDGYLDWLGDWKHSLDAGLTTWPEIADLATTRSDCHAWGASPNIEFFRTVLGINSAGAGFRKVLITPHLGKLRKVSGFIPHPAGQLTTAYAYEKGAWNVHIDLPPYVTGALQFKGKRYVLKAGSNQFRIVGE